MTEVTIKCYYMLTNHDDDHKIEKRKRCCDVLMFDIDISFD